MYVLYSGVFFLQVFQSIFIIQKQNYEADTDHYFSAREHFWSFYNFAFSKRLVRFYFLFF
jgi:hypothetical protein